MTRTVETAFADWLEDVRLEASATEPDLLATLDVYIAEARFGRRYIDENLRRLAPSADVLEVGAGPMLLACQLAREGFSVTALEPTGEGFSHFKRLRELVLRRAVHWGCLPRILNQPAESLTERARFDFAFSVNVMEHVSDVTMAIAKIGESLKPGAGYRFTCPNYRFPYEPHFNIPTLFSKNLTRRCFGRRILNAKGILDPVGTWASLNWINVSQINRAVAIVPGFHARFDYKIFITMIDRIATDPEFARRRGNLLRFFVLILGQLRLHRFVAFIPLFMLPVIDCTILRDRPAD